MSALVSPGFVRTMAAYNAEMNRRLYDASTAFPMPTGERTVVRFGARCTARYAIWCGATGCGWPASTAGRSPTVIQKDSATLIADFDDLRRQRVEAGEKISNWAARVSDDWLAEDHDLVQLSVKKELR